MSRNIFATLKRQRHLKSVDVRAPESELLIV